MIFIGDNVIEKAGLRHFAPRVRQFFQLSIDYAIRNTANKIYFSSKK